MNEKNIVLNNVEAAKEFVKAASECDFDIDVDFQQNCIGCQIPAWYSQPGSEKQAQSLLQRRKRRIQYSSGKICGIIIEAWMFEKETAAWGGSFFLFYAFFC